MPVTASALVLEAPRRLVDRQVPVPATGDDDAVLRVEACGLCGTDHEQFTGDLAARFAFIPGHEVVGVIESIGPAASARWGVAAGERVAVEVFMSCRTCLACKAGDSQRCTHHGLRDMYGYIPVDKAPGLWGGYAQYQYLAPDTVVHRVPPALDPAIATLFNPLGAGIRWAATLPATGPGDVVAILGPGIRGLCSVAAARQAGAGFVMVTGVGPRDLNRLALAGRFGADLAVDVASDDPAASLKAATGGRLADIVVDVTAKAPAALASAISLARTGGTVVVAGTRGSAETPGFWPDLIVYKELRILGALGVDSTSYTAALSMLEAGDLPFADLPRRCEPLSGAASLLEVMAGGGTDVAPVHAVLRP